MSNLKLLVTCPKGLASVLAPELTGFGAAAVRETVTGVECEGSLALAYRICAASRFANRVLLVLSQFAATSADDLYQGIAHLPWVDHIAPGSTLAVDFSGRSDDVRNTQFGAQRCKDAVVDVFRSRGLERPNVDIRQPDVRINVRLYRGRVSVAIDLSGGSLHQRGYRTDPGKAPLKENIAAALLARAGWPELMARGLPLIDPMCGSGTFLIEAALMATGTAPNLYRDRFGFEGWLGHNPAQWQAIHADLRSLIVPVPDGLELRGYDGDIRAVRRAEASIRELGLQDWVRIRPRAINELTRPSHRAMPEGLIICNPPWGERLGDADALKHLYRRLGETLHREFQGWHVGLVTSDLELGRATGLRSHRRYALSNGAIDIQLLLIDLDPDNRLKSAAADVSSHDSAAAPQSFETLSEGAKMFANRLRKNQKRLKPWLKREGISCYRLYDADMPEYAVAVDIYEGEPHIAEYAPPKQVDADAATRRFGEAVAGVRAALGLPPERPVATKRRERQRGREQYQKFAEANERVTVREGRAELLVNLHDYLDTGLFLDHRPLRVKLNAEAQGQHFLNLFCYTGAASIHAALGGAVTSTSVDSSNTYLSWYRENLALNGLSERQHRAVRADCLEWLEQRPAQDDRLFDLILLDPPSFSNSKRSEGSFDVARDQARLLDLTMALLAPGGTLYFSNNRRGFTLEPVLHERYVVTDITPETIAQDFQRRTDIHQCWRFQHRG